MIDPILLSGARRTIAARNGMEEANPDRILNDCPGVPDWVADELNGAPIHRRHLRMATINRECIVCTQSLDAVSLVSVNLPSAIDLVAKDFRRGTSEVYQLIHSVLDGSSAPYPVRMWN